ncbi:MAG: hypothetical protein FWG49_07500, partial [Leptospirales bacterium]|nr:hypothetical protein [Leptospirales bacterium]
MKKYLILIILFCSMLCCYEYGFGRSWSDLDAGEHKIYGREKEEKYRVKALVYDVEDWENHYSKMIFWLYKYTDYPKYRSTRFLPFYYGLNSKIDNRTNMLLIPLLSYFETDGDRKKLYIGFPLYYSSVSSNMSDRSLLFLIWWGRESGNNWIDSYQTIFPVFYHRSETNVKNGNGEYLWVNPLFVSWRDIAPDKEEKHLWWAPIIPLTFHYTNRYGGHRNIFGILDYSWDKEGESDSMERFWFLPLYIWKRGDDGYRIILPPVYINNRHSNGDYYYHLLPIFAAWRDAEYVSEYKSDVITRTTLTLLFGRRTAAEEKSDERIYSNFWLPLIPLFFTSSNKMDESYYTHLFPIYWSWKSEESQGRLILPIYFQYKDDQRDIHINIAGIAKTTYMGPFNPSISASLTNKDDNWYLDSETSWLYAVWSSSARVPIKTPFGSKDDSAGIPQENNIDSKESDQKIGLTSGAERKGRENSEFFRGWKILFGWVAYEKADSQKHVRFFPLTWFTWNEDSEDKVYVFLPFFVSYLSEDAKTEYFVIFPFYLMQKQDQSYLKSYLISLYIDEYDTSEDYHEKTVLWPFINWYDSPDRGGFRVFPIFWRKNWNDSRNEYESSQTITLLYYSKNIKNIKSGEYVYRKRVNPLYYLNEDNNENGSSYSLYVP